MEFKGVNPRGFHTNPGVVSRRKPRKRGFLIVSLFLLSPKMWFIGGEKKLPTKFFLCVQLSLPQKKEPTRGTL